MPKEPTGNAANVWEGDTCPTCRTSQVVLCECGQGEPADHLICLGCGEDVPECDCVSDEGDVQAGSPAASTWRSVVEAKLRFSIDGLEESLPTMVDDPRSFSDPAMELSTLAEITTALIEYLEAPRCLT